MRWSDRPECLSNDLLVVFLDNVLACAPSTGGGVGILDVYGCS